MNMILIGECNCGQIINDRAQNDPNYLLFISQTNVFSFEIFLLIPITVVRTSTKYLLKCTENQIYRVLILGRVNGTVFYIRQF